MASRRGVSHERLAGTSDSALEARLILRFTPDKCKEWLLESNRRKSFCCSLLQLKVLTPVLRHVSQGLAWLNEKQRNCHYVPFRSFSSRAGPKPNWQLI